MVEVKKKKKENLNSDDMIYDSINLWQDNFLICDT